MRDSESSETSKSPWGGRFAVLLILAFTVLVLVLMFFAVRGPR